MREAALNRDECWFEPRPFLSGHLAGLSRKNPERKSANEDCLWAAELAPDHGVLVVADGLGGHRGGAEASRVVIESFEKALDQGPGAGASRTFLLDVLESAHRSIRDLRLGSGSTVSVAEFFGTSVRFFNIGDSVAWWLGGKGAFKYRTWEHSSLGLVKASGLIEETPKLSELAGQWLVNSVGQEAMRIEMSPALDLAPKDIVFLATDGITDNMKEEEWAGILCQGPLQARVEKLSEKVHNRMRRPKAGKADDMSFWIFQNAGEP